MYEPSHRIVGRTERAASTGYSSVKKLLLSAKRSSTLRVAVTGILAFSLRSDAQTPPEPQDKYQWLEDVYGDRSMAWVKAENERSAKVLESDPRFAELETAALKVLESPDRLPTPRSKRQRCLQHLAGRRARAEVFCGARLFRTTLPISLIGRPCWITTPWRNRTTRNGSKRDSTACTRKRVMPGWALRRG